MLFLLYAFKREHMFNTLADRLAAIFDKLRGRGVLTEEMVDTAMREIKIALLEADVALPVVKSFISSVKEQVIGSAEVYEVGVVKDKRVSIKKFKARSEAGFNKWREV